MSVDNSARPSSPSGWLPTALASAALTLPALLAFNLPPSSTFFNQAAALIGWGAWLSVLAASFPNPSVPWPRQRASGLAALQSALAVLLIAALASPFWTGLPWSLALSSAGLIGAAMLTAQVGAAAQRSGFGVAAFRAFCIGLVVAGVASSAIGILQVAAPDWPDGDWIARTYIPGRAVGNLRQPNHLSSLLLWATIAAVWLGEPAGWGRAGRGASGSADGLDGGAARGAVLGRWASSALAALFVFVVVLSGSRTGAVSVGLLAVWGLLDRRLSRHGRMLLLLAPVAYAACWFGASAWADYGHHLFGAETRFSAKGDISSSRYAIWSNTLALIRLHPWAGVGFGEFNFAWTLTPFPGRPVAFFDHTHNLPLQLAVELGLPLAALVLALLAWAGWRALIDALQARGDADPAQAPLRRAAFVMVLMIMLHSQLEYPLWYAYFLLPAAFAFGLCLAGPDAAPKPLPMSTTTSATSSRVPQALTAWRPLAVAALLLMFGSLASLADYARVVVIFAPGEDAAPLAQRIEAGRKSVFFAHHADYAAATSADPATATDPTTRAAADALAGRAADRTTPLPPGPAEAASPALRAFRTAPHYLLDARLMQAWAEALNAAGDTERARFVAQRLKEFRNKQSEAFFAPCEALPPAGEAPPFQCLRPTRAFTYADFR